MCASASDCTCTENSYELYRFGVSILRANKGHHAPYPTHFADQLVYELALLHMGTGIYNMH